MEEKYVIDGYYTFETMCDDSPRGSFGPEIELLIRLTHEDAMFLGQMFEEDDEYFVDHDAALDIVDRVRNAMVEEEDYSEEDSWLFQVIWSSGLKDECVCYYQEHKS